MWTDFYYYSLFSYHWNRNFAFVWVCVGVVWTHRGQMLFIRVFLDHSPLYILRQSLSVNPEHSGLVSPASQLAAMMVGLQGPWVGSGDLSLCSRDCTANATYAQPPPFPTISTFMIKITNPACRRGRHLTSDHCGWLADVARCMDRILA